MADITAHALPSGDAEKMKIDHPTDDTSGGFYFHVKGGLVIELRFHVCTLKHLLGKPY